mgnify:FL=1
MHNEILSESQLELLPLVKKFSLNFGLVRGTAIALHLGHRRSIDFDLFSNKPFDNGSIRKTIIKINKIDRVVFDEKGQYTILVNGVRFTFLEYPFRMAFHHNPATGIRLPDLLTLAAMKAYALGRRAKWKDYVGMYFVIKKYGGLSRIIVRARSMFGKEFNEKVFRAQLSFFDDIDFSEEVAFMPEFETKISLIKSALVGYSL